MSEWLKVVLLGIVEGVTEFLPISSTGHLIIASEFLALRDSLDGTFEIFIQIGAVVAVFAYYRAALWQQARLLVTPPQPEDRASALQLWLGVFVAFIPAAIIGLVLDDWLEARLFNPVAVAIALIVGGVMFLIVERWLQSTRLDEQVTSVNDHPLTMRQAFIVGLWQCLALIPGMSRSGMSIIGGMLAGLDRHRATDFSFYLALPTLGAATLYTLARDFDQLNNADLSFLLLGAAISAVVAWLSIDWLLRYVASNNFVPFGIYRIILGAVILWLFLF
jgi:undecaprenyl-diphosphatase